MPRMGKTEEDWNGLKLGFLKTVQPICFQSWSLLLATSKIMFRRHICLSRISDFVIYIYVNSLLTYFKFYSDWGRLMGKIKQNELDCRDTAHLNNLAFQMCTFHLSDYFLLFSLPPVSYFLEVIIDCPHKEQSLFDRAWKMRQTCVRTVWSGRLSRYVLRGKGRQVFLVGKNACYTGKLLHTN